MGPLPRTLNGKRLIRSARRVGIVAPHGLAVPLIFLRYAKFPDVRVAFLKKTTSTTFTQGLWLRRSHITNWNRLGKVHCPHSNGASRISVLLIDPEKVRVKVAARTAMLHRAFIAFCQTVGTKSSNRGNLSKREPFPNSVSFRFSMEWLNIWFTILTLRPSNALDTFLVRRSHYENC